MTDESPKWTRREVATGALALAGAMPAFESATEPGAVTLPRPLVTGGMPVNAAIAARRSRRRWSGGSLTLAEVSQLLWAAQGVTSGDGYRAAPSAGALYPLELDLASARVDGLPAGLYRYRPRAHRLDRRRDGDLRSALAHAAHGQGWMADAAAVLVISGVRRRTAARYGARAERYVAIEVGHAAHGVYLQATALDLGTTIVGAFDDERLAAALELTEEERPWALLPIGRR